MVQSQPSDLFSLWVHLYHVSPKKLRLMEKGGEKMEDLVVVAIGLLTFAIGFLVRGEISHLRKLKQ